MAFYRLQLTSLVEQNPHPGVHELTLVLSVVVGAKEQIALPALSDENAEQNVSLGAAPIAAICRRENHRCHVMPPWVSECAIRFFDRLWRGLLGETLGKVSRPQLTIRMDGHAMADAAYSAPVDGRSMAGRAGT